MKREIIILLLLITIIQSQVYALYMVTKSYSPELNSYIIREYNDSSFIINYLRNITTNNDYKLYVITENIFKETSSVPKLLKETNPIYTFDDIMNKLNVNGVLYLYVENKSNLFDRTYIMVSTTTPNFITTNLNRITEIGNFFTLYIPNEKLFISSRGITKIKIYSLKINGEDYSNNILIGLNMLTEQDTITINGNDVLIISAGEPNTFTYYGIHIMGDVVYSGFILLNPTSNMIPITESSFNNPFQTIEKVNIQNSSNWYYYYLPSFNIFVRRLATPIYTKTYTYDVAPVINENRKSIIVFVPHNVKSVKVYVEDFDLSDYVKIRKINNKDETIIVIKSKDHKFIDVPLYLKTEYGVYFLGVQSIYPSNTWTQNIQSSSLCFANL